MPGESRSRSRRALGSNPLLLALDVVTGVDGERTLARDRAGKLHGFLQEIDGRVPRDMELHIVVDNDFIRTNEEIAPRPVQPPRWHVHVAPTRIAWIYQAEFWLEALARRPIESPENTSVRQLRSDTRVFLGRHFDGHRPFEWLMSSDDRLIAEAHSGPLDEPAHATGGRVSGQGGRGGSLPMLVDGHHGGEIAVPGNCLGNSRQHEDTGDGSGDAPNSNARPPSKFGHGRLHRTAELFYLAALSNLDAAFNCNSYEVFERAVQALLDARHVLVVGMGPDRACAVHMHRIASKRFRNWHIVESADPASDRNLADLGPVDVVVAIGTAPVCDSTLRVVDYARCRFARVIGLAEWSYSSLVARAHDVLFVSIGSPGPFSSQLAPMALVETLVGSAMARQVNRALQRSPRP